MNPRRVGRILLFLALAIAPAAIAEMSAPRSDAAQDYFTDVALLDQDGREVRLFSDLMAGKVVVINAIFTNCEGVCPVTMGNLVKIQKWLGPRLGEEVRILSLTVDRQTDTPERLQEYARKFDAQPGWHFLTGSPENLDFALRKLGLFVENPESHSSVFLIGNVPTGLWKKAFGMASAKTLVEILSSVLDDELDEAGG